MSVTCTATNACSTNTCSFDVTVTQIAAVGITCPANITVNTAPGACTNIVAFSVTATDLVGIAKVEFFENVPEQAATKVGEATESPYETYWSGVPAGSSRPFELEASAAGAALTAAGTVAARRVPAGSGRARVGAEAFEPRLQRHRRGLRREDHELRAVRRGEYGDGVLGRVDRRADLEADDAALEALAVVPRLEERPVGRVPGPREVETALLHPPLPRLSLKFFLS